MPEMHFRVRWPDQSESLCYSPSLVIKDYFQVGAAYPVSDFLTRSRSALHIASERVRQKYGYGCAHAEVQLAEIERIAARFTAQPDAVVRIESFLD